MEPRLEAEVERRRVDADEHVRRVGDEPPYQRGTDAQAIRQMGQHIDQTECREPLGRPVQPAAGLRHQRPTDPLEGAARAEFLERLDQARTEQVA